MMKEKIKKIVALILKWEAKRVIEKYKPKIVAVTGSVGKTSTKDAIYTALLPFYHVRKSAKSFNSDIGIPLTILGLKNAWSDPKMWLKNIIKGFILILKKSEYPEWLVLEIGADRPGEIKEVMGWIHPDVSVVTRVGKVPVHVEFYKSQEHVAIEKSELVKGVKKDGVVILNADDEDVYEMRKLTQARVVTFSLKSEADVKGSFPQIIYENEMPKGVSFKADIAGSSVPISLNGSIGIQHIYPVLASMAVVYAESLSLLKAGEAFSKHEYAPGRMKLIEGINDSLIIDDTYNASPVALEEGLRALGEIKCSGRKIAVVGDMLELGKHSHEEHLRLGTFAGGIADIIIAVGIRAKDLGNAAIETGKISKENVLFAEDARAAGEILKGLIKEKDIIYIKGSQGVRMERTVEAIMKNPKQKAKMLVRQNPEWLKR